MNVFLAQIVASVIIGYVISSALSLFFVLPLKQEAEKDLNLKRVDMVVDAFVQHNESQSSGNTDVWRFQCDVVAEHDQIQSKDNIHTIVKRYDTDRFILGSFNSEAYQNDPNVKRLLWLDLLDDLIQVVCTLIILLLSLRTWSNGLREMTKLSTEYMRGNFSTRARRIGPKPIKNLIDNQHMMADSLSSLINKQKVIYASLPHDIRTPLASIQLTSDMLLYEQGDNQYLAKKLATQVDSLSTLCESSLYLFKLMSGDIQAVKTEVNLQNILSSFNNVIGSHQTLVTYGCNTNVQTDSAIVRIVFLNIISNALKHAKSQITVSLARYPRHDVLRFSDDGCGIDKQIINAFNAGQLGEIKSQQGYGIGLILIAELAKVLDGTALLSNNGVGGKVTLVIRRD
tara:strand:- start:545 stop:1741 length:1197 start_codon:yes stop_codon:yes gene_type:complete